MRRNRPRAPVPFKHPRPNPPTSFETFPPSRARVAHAHVLYQDFPLRNIIITLPRPPPMLIRARARRFRARLRAIPRPIHRARTTNRDPSRSPSTQRRPSAGARARDRPRARPHPRPSPRALWRLHAPEPRRASDEFHRTPRGASHTAGDVARAGATRDARAFRRRGGRFRTTRPNARRSKRRGHKPCVCV